MEPDAVPAGVRKNAPHALGRRRTPPGDTMTPREELADGVGESPSQKRGPDAVKTPLGAPRGAASFAKGRTHRKVRSKMWRLAALHSLGFIAGKEGKRGVPGAFANNTGDDACLAEAQQRRARLLFDN